MPTTFEKQTKTSQSFGVVCARALIARKAEGHHFTAPALAEFIDVQLEAWQQASPQRPAGTTPEPAKSAAEAIYAAYPRKVGKTAAIRAIKAALKKSPHVANHPDVVLQATKDYAEAVAKWPAKDRAYVPHPATWFNRGSYLDDPKEWQRGDALANALTKPRDYSTI